VTRTALKIIAHGMNFLGLEYGFVRYSKNPVVYPYWVGEYSESPPMYESGHSTSNFMLTGYHRGDWLDLEIEKEKIAEFFNKISGKTVMAEDGSAVAVFYYNALIIPTMDSELKKIQINLEVHEWSVK
jgi:hypothetical protein